MTLRELRGQSGKTRLEVAEAIGVTPNALGKYECGIRQVSLYGVLKLAKLYGTSEREIIVAQLKSVRPRR